MKTKAPLKRCPWPGTEDSLMIAYHDREWGKPVHNDQKIFEFLVLEAFQAGLSWRIILHKRENFRKAFKQFDYQKIARFTARDRARLVNVTSLPLLIKMFRNDEFIFNTPFDFRERLADQRLAQGEGNFIPVREHRHMWETSLVPDLLTFDQMRSSPGRGAGSTNIQFVLGDGTLHSHESEIPVGNYKKAHIHGDGYHIIQLSGSGYSLYWNEGQEPQRVEWEYGVAHSPSRGMWHQHFNVSNTPARYMAAGFGSIRYPVLSEKLEVLNRSYAQGGTFQIEYEDEDPAIRELFDRERAAFRTRAEQA